MFDGITNVWYATSIETSESVEHSARKALNATGEPQGVHRHGPDHHCVRGGGCYVLRRPKDEQ